MDDATLDQKRRLLKVEISPLKPNNLTGAKSQTACDQDHGPIRFPNVQPELVKLLGRQDGWPLQTEGWLFANPATGKPYHQEEIQKKHIRGAAKAAAIKSQVGWKTFRHSFRSWLDQTDAPIGVQRELMRHASIQTTMNVYGRAMTDSKRQAHSNVVQMVLQAETADSATEEKTESLVTMV